MSNHAPLPQKELTTSQRAMLRKVKIGIVIAVGIVLILIGVSFYINLQIKGELQFVNFNWTDHHPLFGSPYVHVEGTIFNSGSSTAGDAQLIIRLYDSQNRLLKTETMDVGDIPAKTYRNISTDIYYSGDANRCESELQWKPYGG